MLDTNTALSALIGGTTRRLIVELDRDLRYPGPSYEEITRNRDVIRERAGLSGSAIDELVDLIFEHVELVPEQTVLSGYETAANATSPHPDANPRRTFADRDEDDVVFLATAIAVDGDVWSDDGVFEHQDHVAWFRTEDVVERSGIDL